MQPIKHILYGLFLIVISMSFHNTLTAQPGPGYWQQAVDYQMEVDMNVETNRYDGHQLLSYTNNSPDTLNRVFYHLFFNAFQPESMMDKRSRTIADPDSRIGDKILGYDETEIGYQRIDWIKQNGTEVEYTVDGTIMEVHLAEPIEPGEVVEFEMEYEAQVPLQTRRSGRDSAEGVRYSMSQWYPKIAAYSERGWHPNPYIGREFFAPFGTFDITIHIDRDYVVGAGAYLQNPREVGYGYEEDGTEVNRPDGDKLTWHFTAFDVHDVMWAADPDYTQSTFQVPDGPLLRFFYQTDPVAENADAERQDDLIDYWEQLPELTSQAFQFMNDNYGEYPHDEYIVIQGGDGGMEYSMGTLITGNRSLGSLIGVTVHEFIHAWYEGVIANDETTDQWIDEGFTVYLSALTMNELYNDGEGDPMVGRHQGYFRTVEAGIEEPMHIHADHYERNAAYGMASYTKGAIFLHQLGYIVGDDVLKSGLNRFYEDWKFKHPRGLDFIRTMEEESGMVLDWYYEYWVTTTKTIDYGISAVETGETVGQTNITLERVDLMPMPIDLEVEYSDGSIEHYYIPMRIMWGQKQNENPDIERHVAEDWPWVFPEYELTIDRPMEDIARIEIDPSRRMADINRDNNAWMEE
ncbi:M1 family metallopeptidase [Rhodohalobacter sp. 8-1]|uniref:M1 family metallopeptidase n=1 Tax=Rhodohalobacter sp. 8-1 TaxID=3131972 RepID=UPI0030EB3A65